MSSEDVKILSRNLEIRIKAMLQSYEGVALTREVVDEIKAKVVKECEHMSYVGHLMLTKKAIDWVAAQMFMTFESGNPTSVDSSGDMNVLHTNDVATLKNVFSGTPLGQALEEEYNKRQS